MNKHNMENIKDSYFVFKTLAQTNIQELFQYHSRKYYTFDITKLHKHENNTYLPIDLKDWTSFEDVLKSSLSINKSFIRETRFLNNNND